MLDRYNWIRNLVYDNKNTDARICYQDPIYEEIVEPKVTIDQVLSENKEYFLVNILGVKFYVACDQIAESAKKVTYNE